MENPCNTCIVGPINNNRRTCVCFDYADYREYLQEKRFQKKIINCKDCIDTHFLTKTKRPTPEACEFCDTNPDITSMEENPIK